MLRHLEISAIAINHDECWFFLAQVNHMYYFNFNTGEKRDCGIVPWEGETTSLLYRSMEYVDGKVYLIPYAAHSIAVYDTIDHQFLRIDLKPSVISGKKYLFRASFTYSGKVFAFGVHAKTIIAIDSCDNSIKYIDEWFSDARRFISNSKGILARKQLAFMNGNAYLPLFYGTLLLAFDYKNEKAYVINTEIDADGFWGITVFGERLYIADKHGRIVSFNPLDHSSEIEFLFDKYNSNEDKYLVANGTGIDIYTANSKMDHLKGSDDRLKTGRYCCICNNLVNTAFWDYDAGGVIVIDANGKRFYDLSINMDDVLYKQFYSKGCMIKEESGPRLAEFLEDICR